MEEKTTFTLHKYSRRDKDLITICDHDYSRDCPDLTRILTIESHKLLEKAIYTQMTTAELKEIKQMINNILKERLNNGK